MTTAPITTPAATTRLAATTSVQTANHAATSGSLHTPDWAKDAIFYQVFPDRFSNGDMGNDPNGTMPWGTPPTNNGMAGGDLNGVTQKLGYMKKLGVDSIYLNPIFESPSNHKYNITNYEHVDPAFGGDAAFKDMVDGAHHIGMKVILDGVFNHVSQQHDWFKDVREKGPNSKYFNRFEVTNWPISYTRDKDGVLRSPDYKGWWGFATLPELKTDNPQVRDYFLTGKDAIVKKWITDGHIDGWRMDVADEIEPDFWREARKEIKSANPEAYMVGENWHDASSMLQGDQFDGTMNYKYFQQPAVNYFAKKDVTTDQFVDSLKNDYSKEAKLAAFNILDTHDTPRFITEAGGDWYRLRPAAIFQMTYQGAPVIYYGDEIGMEGGKDPDSRRDFDWSLVPGQPTHQATASTRLLTEPGTPASLAGSGAVDAITAGTQVSKKERAAQLFGMYQKLIETRKAEPSLRRGDFAVLSTRNDDKTLAYRRWVEGTARDAVVAINNDVTAHNVTIPMDGTASDGTKFTDALSGKSYTVADGHLELDNLDGNWGSVLLRDA